MAIAPNQQLWDGVAFGTQILDNLQKLITENGSIAKVWDMLDAMSTTVGPAFGLTNEQVLNVAMGVQGEWMYDNQPAWAQPAPTMLASIIASFRISCHWTAQQANNFSILISGAPKWNEIATIAAGGPIGYSSPVTPPTGGGDGDGTDDDTLGGDIINLKNAMVIELTAIIVLLKEIQAGGGRDANCCVQVVTAIASVTSILAVISTEVKKIADTPPATEPPVNLAPIVNALDSIAADLKAAPGRDCKTPLAVELCNLPKIDVTVTSPGTDVTKIVEQLAHLVDEGDVKQGILDYLAQQGFLSGNDAQILKGASWSHSIVMVFRTFGWNALRWALSLVGITWDGRKWHFGDVRAAIAGDIENLISDTLSIGSAPLAPFIKGAIAGIVDQLAPKGVVTPGNAGVDPDLLVAKVLTPPLLINFAALVAGYLGYNTSEQLAEYVALAGAVVGLEEIKEIQVGQRMQAGPIAAARIQAQKLYRQTLPGSGDATSWAARGIVAPDAAKTLLALGGYADAFQPLQLLAATSGIQPRQLLRLMPTGLFSNADLEDEMTFSGLRRVSQHRYLLAAPYLATDPQRKQLASTLEKTYSAGLFSDADLTTRIDSSEHNTNRDSLILEKVHLDEAIVIAKALEGEYTTMYEGNLIDHDAYVAALHSLGLQQWKINTLAGIADTKRAVRLARELAAEEKRVIRATVAAERKAALEGFATGTVPAAALLAALVATGMNTEQALAVVTLAELRKVGNQRWIFGLEKTPAAAELLKQQVEDLVTQTSKKLITLDTLQNRLVTLGIPDIWVDALMSRAAAALVAKPKGALIPVELQ